MNYVYTGAGENSEVLDITGAEHSYQYLAIDN